MRGKSRRVIKFEPGAAEKIFVAMLGLGLIFALISGAAGQSAPASIQISDEIHRLKQNLSSLKLPEAEAKPYFDGFKRVETVLQSDYVFLSLYYLQPLRVALMTQEYQRSKSEVAKQGKEAFEAEWRRLGAQLAAKEQVAAEPFANIPAAIKALVENSLGQVQPYHQSGRLYGLNTTINDGLFYLGRAPAFQDFALFCRQLHFAPPRSVLKLRSMEPELSALEAETLAEYKQAADKDLRPFINVNVAMKVAWELNGQKRYFGALLKYLDAALALKLLKASPPSDEQQAALKKQNEAFSQQLSSTKTDHSIGLIYWQLAQRALQPSVEDTIGPEDLKRAAVVIEHVLPRYFTALSKPPRM
jgi:hypothetical protein